jgi:hypothetical protein
MIDLGRCYRQDLLADLGPVLKQITISPADSEIRPRITCAHTITCECYMLILHGSGRIHVLLQYSHLY